MNDEEMLLRVEEPSSFPQIARALSALEPFTKLWNSVVQFQTRNDDWLQGSILSLNPQELDDEVRAT